MTKLSINDLEGLVQEGKFEKKVIKPTYTKEFLSKLYDSLFIGVNLGGICGGVTGLFGVAGYLDGNLSSGDIGTLALIGFLPFGVIGGVLGSDFNNWRKEVEPYIKAGEKIIYKQKNLKFKRNSFTLPANYSEINPNEKIDWEKSLSSVNFNSIYNP